MPSTTKIVAMLFCQLDRAQSLGEIRGGLATGEATLQHLGATAPSRAMLV